MHHESGRIGNSLRRGLMVALVAVAAAGGAAMSAGGSLPPPRQSAATYVLHGSSITALRHEVDASGGAVVATYPTLRDVTAKLTATAAGDLARAGVLVQGDGQVRLTDADVADPAPPDSVYPSVTGAAPVVATGDSGAGITVAVLDTGIDASLPDLEGRVIDGVDLTGHDSPYTDQYGHGTFVAGLIASSGDSSGGRYVGEAPGADLVSIKVAGATGATSVGTILQGIAWAIGHRVTDNIRVLNLSLGEVPESPSVLDVLDQAAEQAWDAGIVVVTSAGNAGPNIGTITSPGNDPLVITVGALDDDAGTNPANYSIPSFSSVGPTRYDGWMKPDLVAPGSSVVSLAAPGSTVDADNPSARIGSANFEGSGTSFSTAIVSGEVALLLAAHPSLTPDEVKSRLVVTADRGPVGNPFIDGHGIADVGRAISAVSVPELGQSAARLAELTSPVFALLSWLIPLSDSWGASTWDPANWTGTPAPGTAWNLPLLPVVTPLVTGAAWNGAAWNGAAWNGAAWNGASWNGAAWNGAAWNGAAWNGAAWNGLLAAPSQHRGKH